MPIKTSVIFGTRPETIKLAPVILAMKQDARFECCVCVTAQHREMLDQALNVFGIAPDADLDLMAPDQTLAGFASRAISGIDQYLAREKPELILIQGDTTTVLCAALAAFYRRIRVGHVEAGLRTGNMDSPWPEEANRVLVSRLAWRHFAPSNAAKSNLLKEGVSPERIHVTGNTGIDALFLALEKIKNTAPEIPGLPGGETAGWTRARKVLITGHRRENFGQGFESICRAVARLAEKYPDVQFVYPVHLNPNVREPVMRILGGARLKNVQLIEPLSYLPFVKLMSLSTLILTDSGGIQEEAPSLGKPVLVMRGNTERPEAVAAGTAKLVGTDPEKIFSETSRLLDDTAAYEQMSKARNPYGDGHAARRILDACAL